jgi:hypothetical protein
MPIAIAKNTTAFRGALSGVLVCEMWYLLAFVVSVIHDSVSLCWHLTSLVMFGILWVGGSASDD